eukprot:6208764-Pleurochrysis_carterae.AAC.2
MDDHVSDMEFHDISLGGKEVVLDVMGWKATSKQRLCPRSDLRRSLCCKSVVNFISKHALP